MKEIVIPFAWGWLPTQLWAAYGVYEMCWKHAPRRIDDTRHEVAVERLGKAHWRNIIGAPIAVGLLVMMVWWAIYATVVML